MLLDLSGPDDFDAAIVSPELFEAMRDNGVPVRGGSTRTAATFDAKELEPYGFRGLPDTVNNIPVNYMIYSSESAMNARPGFAVPLAPHHW